MTGRKKLTDTDKSSEIARLKEQVEEARGVAVVLGKTAMAFVERSKTIEDDPKTPPQHAVALKALRWDFETALKTEVNGKEEKPE